MDVHLSEGAGHCRFPGTLVATRQIASPQEIRHRPVAPFGKKAARSANARSRTVMRPAKGRHASLQPSARALGLKMLGSYEQVPPFRFRRKKIFDVVESGIEFRGRLYRWNEITDFQRFRGVGFIEFSDGTRCRIQMNSFRRVGERRRLSWSGNNPTFRELASYWFDKRVDSRMSPKIEPLKSRIAELEKALDSASDPDEVDRLGRKFMRLNREYLQLQLAYPDEMQAEFERVHRKRRKEHNLVILIAVVLLALSLFAGLIV